MDNSILEQIVKLKEIAGSIEVSIKKGINAHQLYVKNIAQLVRQNILSPYKSGNFSVCAKVKVTDNNGNKYSGIERADPSYNGEFYCFRNREDAETYLSEIQGLKEKKGRKTKFFVQEWPSSRVYRNCMLRANIKSQLAE